MKDVIVLIPSLDPDCEMVKYVRGLVEAGLKKILIVDDGSKEITKPFFEEVESFHEVTVLHHAVNQGKGRALKTGFNYVLNTYSTEEIVGVVTADADGQHSVEDTIKTANKLKCEQGIVLGARNFDSDNVPFKSRSGNKITTVVFKLFYGKYISDTQTGLRGIPYSLLADCMRFSGERFEYEIVMLIEAVRKKVEIIEVPIETIYINSNRATHFHALWDSMRIYKVILGSFLKFALSGLLSFLIDISLFALFTKFFFASFGVAVATFIGTVMARVLSSLFNYSMNKTVVFNGSHDVKRTMFKYYFLCALQMICSWLLVMLVFEQLKWDTTLIKGLVDLFLFFASYHIQRLWVFKEK